MPDRSAALANWKIQVAAALVWAVLFALVFPPANLWPLAYLCLVPLTLLATGGRPWWRSAAVVYLVAAGWTLVMTSWIRPLFPVGHLLMAAVMPLYVAGCVVLLGLIHRRSRLPLTLTVPVVWVGVEWLRGAVVLGGFPYFLLAQSQPTILIQIADAVGVYGVSFLVAMANGLICDAILSLAARRSGGDSPATFRPGNPRLRASLWLWLILLGVSVAYGAWRIAQGPSVQGPALVVAVVQSNVPQSHKMQADETQKLHMLARLLTLSKQAIASSDAARPALIVWPETAVPWPLDDRSAAEFERWSVFARTLHQFVSEHQVALLVGGLAVPWGVEGLPPGSWYNSAFLFTERGIADRYDKVHRLPFGEYIPLVEHWPAARRLLQKILPHRREYWIVQGREPIVFTLDGPAGPWSFGAPICFEDVMTAVPRAMVWSAGRKRADALINISNDGWFAGTTQGAHHEQMARFRCVENRVPMARAVNTGISGFIDSTGRVTGRVTTNGQMQNVEGAATSEMRGDVRRTLFGVIGDSLPLACVGAILLLCVGRTGRALVLARRASPAAANAAPRVIA